MLIQEQAVKHSESNGRGSHTQLTVQVIKISKTNFTSTIIPAVNGVAAPLMSMNSQFSATSYSKQELLKFV